MDSIHSISYWYSWSPVSESKKHSDKGGGPGGKFEITYNMLQPYVLSSSSSCSNDACYKFVSHISYQQATELSRSKANYLICRIPLEGVAYHLTLGQAKAIAKVHGVFIPYRASLSIVINSLIKHRCSHICYDNVFVFNPLVSKKPSQPIQRTWNKTSKRYKKAEAKRKQTDDFKNKRKIENRKAYKRKIENRKAYHRQKENKSFFPPPA
jgi:hypothetical protein